MTKKRKIIYTGVLLIVGASFFVAGFFTSSILNSQYDPGLSLLAKRVQRNEGSDYHINFSSLRQDIQDYINRFGEDAERISVYFEYLPTGASIHINENAESVGASLMKVPVAMMLYKHAAEGKVDLEKTVALKQEWLDNEYGDLYKKGVGYELTIREAARLMLIDSDNTALHLLIDNISGDFMFDSDSVANFLDIDYKITEEQRLLIGARSYSSILKCLYLACYNSRQDSQEILQYLTESSFNDRLMLYLPDDLTVAHKIGTFSDAYQSDCGIFYVPNRRYLLCVMVRGEDPAASRIIADISQKAFLFVDRKIPNTPHQSLD